MSTVADQALQLLGVPFHHQGRHRTAGLDCVGLLVEAAKGAGRRLQDFTAYGRRPRPDVLLRHLLVNLEQLPDGTEPEPDDVLVFWLLRPHQPQHLAIMGEGGLFIHTDQHVGQVVESRFSPSWRRHLHSVWRFRETC